MKFLVPVTFDSANRKRDKSVGLRFTTNKELSTDEYMVLDRLIMHSGWLVYSDNEIQPGEVPDVPADEALGKMTPSQELRWLLRKLWEQEGSDMEWPDYYRYQVGRFAADVRVRLNNL
jgi:hypothetical protein